MDSNGLRLLSNGFPLLQGIIPYIPDDSEEEKQQILFGTHTSGAEQDYLMIAEVVLQQAEPVGSNKSAAPE